jgi:hypothetical protein
VKPALSDPIIIIIQTQVPLETVLGITMTPKNGIHLRIVSRQSAEE